MTSFSPASYRVSSARSQPMDQCYDYSSSGLRCRAEGRETLPARGLFSEEHGALKKSPQLCAFAEVSRCSELWVYKSDCPPQACPCLHSSAVRACAVTSAGVGQALAVLLVPNEDAPVVKTSSKEIHQIQPLSGWRISCRTLSSFLFFFFPLVKHCWVSHSLITSVNVS